MKGMKTQVALFELLALDSGRLGILAACGDRQLYREEMVPARAETERALGTKLVDRSPERRN